MTTFLITSHANGGVRGLTMKGQRLGDGEEMIEFERRFALDCGTELVVMHEFEVPTQAVIGGGPSVLDWDEAKRVADAFWAGHDAPRLPNDWRGCPIHNGDYHDRINVVSMGDLHSHEPSGVVLGTREQIEELRVELKGQPFWLDEVAVMTPDGVREDLISYRDACKGEGSHE